MFLFYFRDIHWHSCGSLHFEENIILIVSIKNTLRWNWKFSIQSYTWPEICVKIVRNIEISYAMLFLANILMSDIVHQCYPKGA